MGFVLLALGLLAIAFGLFYFFKMKRLASAPFKKTGEIATQPSAADARGMISAQGRVIATSPARAPCSGQACLYYEVTVERHWERSVATKNGTRKESGKTQVAKEHGGAVFQLDDGSGPLSVDSRDGADADLTRSHDQRIPVGETIPAELTFGTMRFAAPKHLAGIGADATVAFTALEKTLPAEGTLYACGKLANGVIGKPSWTSLVLSRRGRAALIGWNKAKAFAGLLAGGLFTAAAIPALLFAPLTGFGFTSDASPGANATASSGGVPATSAPPPPSATATPSVAPPPPSPLPPPPPPVPTPPTNKREASPASGGTKSPASTRKK
jgi:hypothetical protein